MQEEIENIQADANEGIVLTDVDLQAKIKKLLKDLVTEASYLKLILNGYAPHFLGMLVEVLVCYISAYFQAKFFGVQYYEIMLTYQAFLNIFSKYFTYSIAEKHAVTVQIMDRNNQTDKIQEQAENFFRIQFMYGVFCSILCVSVGFAIMKPQYSAFNAYLVASAVFQPIGNALSSAYYIVFTLENRRFLVLALLTLRPILQLAIEAMAYGFYNSETGHLKTNWPTTLGTCLSIGLQTVWILSLNFGKTMLGATNLTNYKLHGGIFKPSTWFVGKLWRQFWQYSEALFSAITNLTMQIAVIICCIYTRQVFVNSDSASNMMYQLFVFFYFGQIFRIAPTTLNTLFANVSIHNIIDKNYKRINNISVMIILISLATNVVLFVLLIFVDIIQRMSHTNFLDANISTTLLYSAISGFGQTLTELAVSHAMIERVSLQIIILPIFKLIQVFVGANYLKTTIGDEADFVLVLFFTEMNTTFCSLIIYVVQYVSYVMRHKSHTRHQASSTKASLEEQLASLQ